MHLDILRSVSGLSHMWKQIRYKSDMSQCDYHVNRQIGFSVALCPIRH